MSQHRGEKLWHVGEEAADRRSKLWMASIFFIALLLLGGKIAYDAGLEHSGLGE